MRCSLAGLVLLATAPAVAQMAPPPPATPAGPIGNAAPAATMPAPMPGAAAMPVGTSTAAADYALGVGDQVRITVFNEPTLTNQYAVNADGAVSLPLVGNVHAAGLTSSRLAAAVQQSLAHGYLNNPRVAVDVVTFRPFYILGEVTKPGTYPATAGLSVVGAVATAEGFTYRASKRWAYIKHVGQAQEEKVPLTPDLMVAPGDTIRIGERFF